MSNEIKTHWNMVVDTDGSERMYWHVKDANGAFCYGGVMSRRAYEITYGPVPVEVRANCIPMAAVMTYKAER